MPDEKGLSLLILAALFLALLTAQAAVLVDFERPVGFVGACLLHGAAYVAAVALVLRYPGGRYTLAAILIAALLLRALAMTALPNLTTDALRYVWDGRLGWEGISPYLFTPSDERLIHLRDAAIYPDINQKETAVTIYPPVAQIIFMAGVAIQDGIGGMKALMLAFEAVTIAALIGWMRTEGLPASRVVIYAWHPVTIWEFAGQAHIDAAATAFLTLGILAAVRRRQGLSGSLFAFAALVKYFPLVLLPALWRRWDWKLPVALLGTAAALYLPYVLGAGSAVIGFLGQHLDNEGYRAGWGFHVIWFLRDFNIADPPGWLYLSAAAASLIALALWALFQRRADEFRPERLVLLGAAFAVLSSPHYPWYFGFLCALAVRIPHPALILMTLMCVTMHLPRDQDLSWTEVYAATFVLPLVVLTLWELAVRLSPTLRRLNGQILRLDTHNTRL